MLLTLPPASKAEETKPLLELSLNLLDVLAGGVVPSEVSNRGVRSSFRHSRSIADIRVLPIPAPSTDWHNILLLIMRAYRESAEQKSTPYCCPNPEKKPKKRA